MRLWLLAGLCLALSGCVHKPPKVVVPTIVRTPVEVPEIAEPAKLPVIASEPTPTTRVPVAARVERDLKRWRRRPAAKTIAPVVVPPAAPPPTPAAPSDAVQIGALTIGGEQGADRQQAGEMIAQIDRRLSGLSAEVIRDKQAQILQVRDFRAKARAALDSGDANGAVTLATKARLLLDDLLP
jgi:hypothetical protein